MKDISSESSSIQMRRRKIALIAVALALAVLLITIGIYMGLRSLHHNGKDDGQRKTAPGKEDGEGKENGDAKAERPHRIRSDKCSISDIQVSQAAADPLPNGIPTFRVEISNIGPSSCNISNIHLRCGWFSTARMVNPRVFRRLKFDDCLVNNGRPLVFGRILSFQYATSFLIPLNVSSVRC